MTNFFFFFQKAISVKCAVPYLQLAQEIKLMPGAVYYPVKLFFFINFSYKNHLLIDSFFSHDFWELDSQHNRLTDK